MNVPQIICAGCAEPTSITRTLRLKVRGESYAWLDAAAVEVNQVWNWANETSAKAARPFAGKTKWLSGFDLNNLSAGAVEYFDYIGANTVQLINQQFSSKRRQFRKTRLRWRVSRGARKSLGWVPFKAVSLTRKGRALHFCGKTFRVFEPARLDGAKWKQGCFAQDAVGDWWLCLPVEIAVESNVAPLESVGIDLGLKTIATTSDGDTLEAGRWTHGIADKLAMAQRRGHKRQAKRLQRRAARRRKDALHKFSRKIVDQYQHIVVGDVSSTKLVKTKMAKSVLDSGWGMLKNHHYPTVPNLGDVTKVGESTVAALGHIDIVIGGFPCQDVSVAGKREGLERDDGSTTRSGLFFDALRIADWAKPRWLIVENVPGLFSNKGGRDFAAVVGAMAGCEFDVPADGWRNAGVVFGPKGLVEWSVLDAQYHRLAQRRRRVFIVRDSGDWRHRPPLFLESYRLQGNPAPSRKTQQDVAGTIAGGARKRGGFSYDDVAQVAGTLQSSGKAAGSATQQDAESDLLVAYQATGDSCWRRGIGPLSASDDNGSNHVIAHALRADGFDASEDGTGRGTPIIPICFDETQITSAENRCNPQAGDPSHPLAAGARPPTIAFDCKASGRNGFGTGEIAPTLRAMGHKDSHSNADGQIAVQQSMAVRRLTPTECARLQGFPDDYLDIIYRGKPAADGPKYKALGNSKAVPVVRWLGQRIQMVERILRERAA